MTLRSFLLPWRDANAWLRTFYVFLYWAWLYLDIGIVCAVLEVVKW